MDSEISPLRRKRLELEKSLSDIATAVGISKPSLSNIERGLQRPSLDTVKKLSKEVGLPPAEIDPRLADIVNSGVAE